MKCAWQELINLLPVWMRKDVDRLGADTLQELRLRIRYKPELVRSDGSVFLDQTVTVDDLLFCVNTASRYSPWSAGTVSQGYITAPGGHRIGICGNATINNGQMSGIAAPSSLCIRVARDFYGISGVIADQTGSILILGRPGSGKTTLLRDLIRKRSDNQSGSIGVVDEKGELFPHIRNESCFPTGSRTDVLSGCSKPHGIEAILRNMGPSAIAVDEITAQEDCKALLHAGWCGVDILATAHAANKKDLYRRPVYKSIVDSRLFDTLVILRTDKTWYMERIGT